MKRAVLDTNVYVSALLVPRGAPGLLLEALGLGRFFACSSEHLWSELERAVRYPKITSLLTRRGRPDAADVFLTRLRPLVEIVEVAEPRERWVEGDPDDDFVIECALSAEADVIVTGDRGLQTVEHPPVTIVTPAEALALLGERA